MTDELITDSARIGAILSEMRQCVRVLNVRLDPEGPLYSSSVIRLDPEQRTLFLDELNPQVGHWSLDPGQAIGVHASLRGVAVRFTTGIAEILSEDGIALYACPYPETLRYLQRRETFRIHLPLGERRGIRLQHPGSGAALIGRIIDLSAQGFCVELAPEDIAQ
ncbi:MAG: flagellar brake protein, partial [Chromatiaceae bacterium]|nr:flagellar brake protein [Chromatiaceae bacterium]